MLYLSRKQLISLVNIFILIGLFFFNPISANASNEILIFKKPVINELDLFLDGSGTAITINLTKNFDYVCRFIYDLHFESNDLHFTSFGASGAGNLSTGVAVFYENELMFAKNITSIHAFTHTSYDIVILTDDKNPKVNHLACRLSFFKFVPPWGLRILNNQSLQFIVADDITAVARAISHFSVTIEGFTIDETKEVKKPPSNPFETLNSWFAWFLASFGPWLIGILVFAILILLYKRLT